MFEASDIIGNIKKQLECKINTACEKIMSSKVGLFVYYGVTWYVKTSERAKRYYKQIYDTRPLFKYCVDHTFYGIKYILSIANNQKIEPMQSNWICSSIMMVRDQNRFSGDSHNCVETYDFLKSVDNVSDSYSSAALSMDSIIKSSNIIKEGMVTMKTDNKYANTIYYKNKNVGINDLIESVNITEPSNISFLSIKYTHPIMKSAIFIDLPKGYYYANNEILSSFFIKRHLEYQHLNYHFDDDYVVEIMDNNIQTIELRKNQYILLRESTYTVVNMSE
jgi:hypothetical protein